MSVERIVGTESEVLREEGVEEGYGESIFLCRTCLERTSGMESVGTRSRSSTRGQERRNSFERKDEVGDEVRALEGDEF